MKESLMTIESKKGIMFSTGEDFYVYTYAIIIILEVLGCKGQKLFKDCRKMPYLIDFIINSRSADILELYSNRVIKSKVDKVALTEAYSRAALRRGEVFKIIFSLEKKGIVVLQRGRKLDQVDVSLVSESVPVDMLDRVVFETEFNNAEIMAKTAKKLSTLTLETTVEKFFGAYGVKAWAV
jgi:hypothetical protein